MSSVSGVVGRGEDAGRTVLVTAAALVAAQAVALLVVAGWEAVASVTRGPADPVTAWVAVALGLLAGTCLALVARGLVRRRRWARSPALVTQILGLPVALSLVQSGLPGLGVPLLAVTATAGALLLSPPLGRSLD